MSLDPARARAWHRLGIGPVWVMRDSNAAAIADEPDPVPAPVSVVASGPGSPATQSALTRPMPPPVVRRAATDARAIEIAAMDWDELRQAVAGCTACSLCTTRKQTVFGVGHQQARWMLI